MASDNNSLIEQMEELTRHLETTSSALKDLSIQLKNLEQGSVTNKTDISPLAVPTRSNNPDEHTPRRSGYVNWNSSHDILKIEHWKELDILTRACGKLERKEISNFYEHFNLNGENVVGEETRFPEDDVYVNVSSPLVGAEILYLAETRSATGLVEHFLNKVKTEIHTRSSFEKKYGLKWVVPSKLSEGKTVTAASFKPIGGDTDTKPVAPDSWCLPEDANLEVNSEMTLTTFEKENLSEDELMAKELSKKFKEILGDLDPHKLDTVVNEVKALEINTEKKMNNIIEVLFEKILEEPEFAELYAALCLKLRTLKVPSDNNPDIFVSFRGLIIGKCQTHFETAQSYLPEKIWETNDPAINGEPTIDEINTLSRMRAVANVKFIGELYKLNIITFKIVDYIIRKLINELNEVKLECLCELLITAGKEFDGKICLDNHFTKLQFIVDNKTNKVNSRVKSLIQDVIDLRKRKWGLNIVKALPKTMDQIQDETEKRALLIQLMNDFDMGGRGDGENGAMVSLEKRENGKNANKIVYTVDALKLEAASHDTQNYIKLPPNCLENKSVKMNYVLEKLQADPTTRREMMVDLEVTPTYRADKTSISSLKTPVNPQKPFNLQRVKPIIDEFLINPDNDELVTEIKDRIPLQFHIAVVGEIMNVILEKSIKEVDIISKSLNHLVETETIAPENFIAGLKNTFEIAPDLFIDIPILYEYLGKILAPHIRYDHITFAEILDLSDNIISANQGHLLLKSILKCLNNSMGQTYVQILCQESILQLTQWMSEELARGWISDNHFEFLEGFLC